MIIKRNPLAHEVVINLERLYKSDRFIRSIEACQNAAPLRYIRKWMGSQSEVVLRVSTFDRDGDVVSWGGRVGTMQQLEGAARSINVADDQIALLATKLGDAGVNTGDPWWTTDQGAQNIILNVLEKAHALGLFHGL